MNDTVIGALGALGSILFFGSYAVFIRSPSVMAVNVDPIVFQTYKSFACFCTSWLVLFYAPLKFTWWGMAGAGLWVITGIGAITAVRLAGIGPTQALWSALSIFVSYIWGAYFFKEPIRNQFLALLALTIMAAGMVGVTWATAGGGSLSGQAEKSWTLVVRSIRAKKKCWGFRRSSSSQEDDEIKRLITDSEQSLPKTIPDEDWKAKADAEDRFFKGVMAAVFVGFTNGSCMIPLEYANKDVVGVEYIISFGVGAITITLGILAAHSMILVSSGKPLPSFHFSIVAGPALLTGLFWSVGNFCSIYATMYLGMSLGFPLAQCQLLISALWAVFYYKEVTERELIFGLLGSSVLVVMGAAVLTRFGTYK